MKEFIKHNLLFDVASTGGFEIDTLENFYARQIDNGERKMHTHDFYLIIWFQEDGGTHTVDFVEYPVKKNTFFFITPGQLHCYDNTYTKGVAMKFVPEFLNDEYTTEDIYLKYSIFNAFDSYPYLVINNPDLIRSIQHILSGIRHEMPKSGAFGHHTFMQSLVRVLLIVFQRYDGTTDKLCTEECPEHNQLNITNNIHSHFLRFRQALEKEYKRLHNVKDYASLLNVGTKYLTTIVKECSHRTPLQLINERILLEAKRQLRYSNKMVKEIAFDLGYEDPSYFVKQFKRQTGLLPTEFREM